MKQFLYRIQPSRPGMLTEATERENAIVEAHFEYLQDLARRGIVLLAGRTLDTDERTFGIVVFLAESNEEARRIMDEDPAVVAGVMHAELFPFRVALAASDWSAMG